MPLQEPLSEERITELLTQLRDADRTERIQAAHAIREVHDNRFIDPLIVALTDEDEEVRWEAMWAIGGYRDADARTIGPLLYIARHDDLTNRWLAIENLSSINDPRILPALQRMRVDTDYRELYTDIECAIGRVTWRENNRAII